MRCFSIVIADRHPVVLEGLRSVLEPLEDFRVVACCGDSVDLVQAIERLAPDIALVDICPGNLIEPQIIAVITKSSTRLVLFTGAAENNKLNALATTDICTLIPKQTSLEILVQLLRQIGAGQKQAVLAAPENVAAAPGKNDAIAKNIHAKLTDREREITGLVSEGLSNKVIARRLNLSHGTIKVHLHNIYQKLEIHNRTLLAAMAFAGQ